MIQRKPTGGTSISGNDQDGHGMMKSDTFKGFRTHVVATTVCTTVSVHTLTCCTHIFLHRARAQSHLHIFTRVHIHARLKSCQKKVVACVCHTSPSRLLHSHVSPSLLFFDGHFVRVVTNWANNEGFDCRDPSTDKFSHCWCILRKYQEVFIAPRVASQFLRFPKTPESNTQLRGEELHSLQCR